MPKYIIATASTADLTREYLDAHQIPFIRYSYELNGDVIFDDCREESRTAVYTKMRSGSLPTTAAINVFSYREFFEPLLKQGLDVVFLDMARAMSSSCRACDAAVAELKEEYPQRSIYNVDTRCISGGLGLLVQQAQERFEQGMSCEELLNWLDENKLKIAHRFTVESLEWLRRGGRLSNASAVVGTLLAVKPVMYVPDEGTLVAAYKVRGRKASLNKIIDLIKNDVTDPANQIIHINHADCMADAQAVKEALLAAIPGLPAEAVTISGLGVVIGAHTGPGLIAVFYPTAKRVP